ncbi:tetratricopeptide repeat protein, partial [Erythrobacter sp.]|uniref:tetratricopeptide repeat protein n=1 Tax=Erythrobacter sp. TaxID=1042 RepID=UPI003C71C6E5
MKPNATLPPIPRAALARRLSACLAMAIVAGLAAAPFPASAQGSASREVVQPLPSPAVQRLNRALMELARSPQELRALVEAADASLAVGDYDAAIGFYGRAADIAPSDPRVRLGTARVYLRSGRPVEALPIFDAAQASGAPMAEVLLDRGLALDMVGDQVSAQSAYARALELDPANDEARRRLALSKAISGDADAFQDTLAPLLEQRDFAAFRVRAFGLAILGESDRATAIADAVMPPDLAGRITPYLAFMPRLTPAQQAAAANLGIFPRAAEIGRENARIARFASQNRADRQLEPAGEPLGPSQTATTAPPSVAPPSVAPEATVSQEVAQAVPRTTPQTVSQPVVQAPRSTAAPEAIVTARNAAALPGIATRETGNRPAPPAARVADAFADLDSPTRPAARAASGAVDIASIAAPRDPAPDT